MEQNSIDIILYIGKVIDVLGVLYDNTPHSISMGCIFMFIENNNIKISRKYLANICDASEVTISKTYKIIKPYTEYLFPPM